MIKLFVLILLKFKIMEKHRIFTTPLASVYPHYIQKAQKNDAPKKR